MNSTKTTTTSTTRSPPNSRLPGGYVLRYLLATTHFSSVWLASAPWTSTTSNRNSQPSAAPDSTEHATPTDLLDVPDEDSNGFVVVKALDASRPTHAAVAANEAAVLRHLAACVSSTAVTTSTTSAAVAVAPDTPSALANAKQVPAHSVAATACTSAGACAFPFVRLLGTFTTDVLPQPCGMGDASGGPGPSSLASPAASGKGATAEPSTGQRRRWRCLVLERLGPTATKMLEAWQGPRWQKRQERQQQQRPKLGQSQQQQDQRHQHSRWESATAGQAQADGLGVASIALHTGRHGAVGRASGGGAGGLGPDVVRCFAVQALGALDLMHRSARLVHCDVKPDNFALKWRPLDDGNDMPMWGLAVADAQTSPGGSAGPAGTFAQRQDGQPLPLLQGEAWAERRRRGEERQQQRWPSRENGGWPGASWALLDFGSACSLEPGGQRVADGPAGRDARGYVRPCGALKGDGGDDDEGDDHVWYDTPSYAAPELTLGLPPSPAADIWSLGCTVYELATGAKLLPLPPQLLTADRDGGRDVPDAAEFHLALVTQLLGRPPAALLHRAPQAGWYFNVPQRRPLMEEEFELPPLRPLAQRLALPGRHGGGDGGRGGVVKAAVACLPVATVERGHGGGFSAAPGLWEVRGSEVAGNARAEAVVSEMEAVEWDEAEWAGLHSFLVPLLQWDPQDRPPAHVAARHPWLAGPGGGGR